MHDAYYIQDKMVVASHVKAGWTTRSFIFVQYERYSPQARPDCYGGYIVPHAHLVFSLLYSTYRIAQVCLFASASTVLCTNGHLDPTDMMKNSLPLMSQSGLMIEFNMVLTALHLSY